MSFSKKDWSSRKNLQNSKEDFDEHGHETDTYALQEQEESTEDSKVELWKIGREATLERLLLALKADLKRLVGSKKEKPALSASRTMGMLGIQLPKIEVPTFDGNLLNWQIFWEQFESTIHS